MRYALFPVTVAAIALSVTPRAAFAAAPAAIQVTGAWSRPVPAGLPTGAVYLTITNRGHEPDRLVGAQTPVAAHMTLHRTTMVKGMMSMEAVPGGVEIAPGGMLKVEPGGYHFMLEGLKGALAPGGRFPATLNFAHAGWVKIEVKVQGAPQAAMTMR